MKRLIRRLLRRREPDRPATASEIEAMSDPLIEWQSEKWWYQQQLHLTRRVEFLTGCIAVMTLVVTVITFINGAIAFLDYVKE